MSPSTSACAVARTRLEDKQGHLLESALPRRRRALFLSDQCFGAFFCACVCVYVSYYMANV